MTDKQVGIILGIIFSIFVVIGWQFVESLWGHLCH